jgi:flavin-dependent dehydrogenase
MPPGDRTFAQDILRGLIGQVICCRLIDALLRFAAPSAGSLAADVWYSTYMKVGIVGARLAGSYAALILSRLGHEVLLLDPSKGGEKACGGGITAKAHLSISCLKEIRLPYSEIRTVELSTSQGYSAALPLRHPIQVFSRAALDGALRMQALQAGACFIGERALRFHSNGNGWAIEVSSGTTHEVDFLVGADGAASSVRAAVSDKLGAEDLSLALGYYLPGIYHPDKVVIVFQERGFRGYLWSFPRVDHVSIGIIQRLADVRASDLRRRVADFILMRYPSASLGDLKFYAARVPCLRRRTLANQRVCGCNWALLGDAAGFADAITAEGIFFALRSAEMLGEAIQAGQPSSYGQRCRLDFGVDLDLAAAWRERFYTGTILHDSFTHRAIQMIERSATVRCITDGLISGRQTYAQLRARLLSRSLLILAETLGATIFTRRH